MTEDPLKSAEDVYIEVYGIMTAKADYVQPEHGVDLFLPHEVIELLTTTALVSLTAGLFSEFGKRTAGKISIKPFRKAKLVQIDRADLINELAQTLNAETIDRVKIRSAKAQLISALIDAGIAKSIAEKIADDVVRAFLRIAEGGDSESR